MTFSTIRALACTLCLLVLAVLLPTTTAAAHTLEAEKTVDGTTHHDERHLAFCNEWETCSCSLDDWQADFGADYLVRGFTKAFQKAHAPKAFRCVDWDVAKGRVKTKWLNDNEKGNEFHTKIQREIPRNYHKIEDTSALVDFRAYVDEYTRGKTQVFVESFALPVKGKGIDLKKYELNVWLWRADKSSADVKWELEHKFDYTPMAGISDRDDLAFFYKYDQSSTVDGQGQNEFDVFRFRVIADWDVTVPTFDIYSVDLGEMWNHVVDNYPTQKHPKYEMSGEETYSKIGFGVNQKVDKDDNKNVIPSRGTIVFSEFDIDIV